MARLDEYTVELETRPMVVFEEAALDRLQEAAAKVGMSDPVFSISESTGSILVVFQVWAASIALAAALGCWMFFTTMVRSGFDREASQDVEMISVSKMGTEGIGEQLKVLVQLPKENART